MVKRISKADLAKLQRNGASIHKKQKIITQKKQVNTPAVKKEVKNKTSVVSDVDRLLPKVKVDKILSDTEVVKIHKKTVALVEQVSKQTAKDNKILLTEMIEIVNGNKVTKAIINRGKNNLITDVDFIRG